MSFKNIQNKIGSSNEKMAQIEFDQNLLTNLRQSFDTLIKKSNPITPDDVAQKDRFLSALKKLKIGLNTLSLNDMLDINNALNERIAELEQTPDDKVDLDDLKARLKDFRQIQQSLRPK